MVLRQVVNEFRKWLEIGKSVMGKYVLIVQSQPKKGRDDEYNEWFDRTHFAEMSDLPGVKSGRRLQATPIVVGAPGLPYVSMFEIETDNPGTLMAEMGKRSSDGTWKGSDALDAPATVLWLYKDYEMPS